MIPFKLLIITSFCAILLLPLIFGINDSSRELQVVYADSWNRQIQESSLDLNSSDLKQPHILKISTNATQLRGQIKLNGRLLQSLKTSGNQVNLSPYLKVGRQVLEISGQYSPRSASVKIEFLGKNTQINQQTQGSSYLEQRFIINVR